MPVTCFKNPDRLLEFTPQFLTEGIMRNKLHTFGQLILRCAFICQFGPAAAGSMQITQDFEKSPTPGWFADGVGAGFDFGKGLAREGQGNAWIGRKTGPASIATSLDIPKYSLCSIQVWIKLSPSFAGGSLYVSAGDGKTHEGVIKELKLPQPVQVFPNPTEYSPYRFDFNTGPNAKVSFIASLTAKDENSWELVDDFGVSCKTPS